MSSEGTWSTWTGAVTVSQHAGWRNSPCCSVFIISPAANALHMNMNMTCATQAEAHVLGTCVGCTCGHSHTCCAAARGGIVRERFSDHNSILRFPKGKANDTPRIVWFHTAYTTLSCITFAASSASYMRGSILAKMTPSSSSTIVESATAF